MELHLYGKGHCRTNWNTTTQADEYNGSSDHSIAILNQLNKFQEQELKQSIFIGGAQNQHSSSSL